MFIPLMLVLGLGTTFFLSRNSDREDVNFQINVFFFAFALRIWVGFILYGWNLGKLIGDEDATGYITGWYFAENWYNNGFDGFVSDMFKVLFTSQNVGQSAIWGSFMFIAGGPSRMIVSVINSFAGSVLVMVIYRLAKRLFDFQTAKIAAVLMTFWLSLVLLSAGTAKEMLVICLEWSILYLSIRNIKSLTQKDIILAAPLMIALYTVRFYAFYICAGALFFRAIITNKKHFVRNAVLGFILVASLLVMLNASGVIKRDFTQLDTKNQSIEAWRENVATSTGSGIEVYSEYQNSPLKLPIATIYFFFAPFPWQIFDGSLRNSFAAVENVFLIFLLILGFPSIKIFLKENFYLILPIIVFCVLYAGFQIWGLSNVGLAWRHKQTVMPFIFLLSAFGLKNTIQNQRSTRQSVKGRPFQINRIT